MTIPSFSISPTPHTAADTLVIFGIFEDEAQLKLFAPPEFSHLLDIAKSLDASAALESLTRALDPSAPGVSVAFVGLGLSKPSPDELRLAAGATARRFNDKQNLEFVFPFETKEELLATLEGALLGAYTFSRYKSTKSAEPRQRIEHVAIRSSLNVSDVDAKVVGEKCAAVALVKDLVNTPARDLTPVDLAAIATDLTQDSKIHATMWDEELLAKDGFGGILGVGQGSAHPPRLVKLEYHPSKATRHVALVGKGITFDTGGLTLKSSTGMVGMKYDMTGAATVLAVVRALAALGAPIRITSWLPLAENMPSASATRPNDVLTLRNGKTVEVLNTDAEGRLVLGDALAAASEESPDLIVDVATLTGAARSALGTRTVGAMGNTDDVSRLVETARTSGEALWRMPLPQELRALLNSDVADLINGRPGNTVAGMLLGGVFLSEFVGTRKNGGSEESIPWIHLDIAGTADNSGSPYGFTGAGPTGVTVRALIDFLLAGG